MIFLSRWLCAGLLLGLLAACGPKSVEVREEFPVPVMQQHPVDVGLIASDAFSGYRHSEKLPGAGEWEIAIGPANLALFTRLLDGMFARVIPVSQAGSAAGVTVVVEPELVDYQFSTPELSFTRFYEAWFKYQIRFLTADGSSISEWPLTAYGRSEAKFLGGDEALRDATEIALRDAAAGFALRFTRDVELQEFLTGQGQVDGGS